ncbi:NlpC/P60 family protein [Chryseobacterium soldanellicola]|uniref:NlpC/P60 family protein n=1 Tax=Chryseobacterium soldanellicola TaxID=311333 RepID=A0A1H0YQA3_9FLAO|nr:NlpC/P60 family protein [Chryseobacterium soldanellicola]SDQ17248.1 NlpC/P60 family protein [Chryseobacterium soldanellicola]
MMNINRYFYLFIVYFVFYSCESKKYIKEIPYNYSSDEYFKEKYQQKEPDASRYSNVEDNSEGLNDDTLRVKEKYSIILGAMPKDIRNYKLYAYLDEWLETPYKENMLEKGVGVETSYFVQALYSDVYGVTFSKTPDGIFRSKNIQLFTGRTFLQEGDILFFRYDKMHPISDVGIYLHHDRIVACTSKGLNIYDFNDEYFQLRYVAAGRLKQK